jgi:hypothetical protein
LRGSHVSIQNSADAEITRRSHYGIGAYGAGANLALRSSAFERIGGFNVALGVGTPARGGEDLATLMTNLWTGGLMVYEPAAFVHHRHRRGYGELLSQLEGYGLGYTAMLTSLVLSDPGHLLSLSSQLPSALGRKITQGIERIRGKRSGEASNQAATSPYPSTLVKP